MLTALQCSTSVVWSYNQREKKSMDEKGKQNRAAQKTAVKWREVEERDGAEGW